MVAFNTPGQPGQDNSPNFFKYSEPIKQPLADTSTGQILKTIGEGIEGGSSLVDAGIKGSIDKNLQDKVDKERDDFTSALNSVRSALGSPVVPSPVQSGSGVAAGESLTSEAPTAPVPPSVDVMVGKADAIQSALINGKINDTYYHQRLSDIQKTARAQYPGYRDYIDQKISQITGVNPANAYINDLMQDINRAAVNKKTEADKDLDMARRAIERRVPNADVMFNKLQADPSFAPQFRSWLAGAQTIMETIQQKEAQRNLAKGEKDDIAVQRKQDFTNEAESIVAHNMNTMVTISGMDNPVSILDFMSKAAADPKSFTSEQYRLFDTKLMAQAALVEAQLKARSTQTNKDAKGNPYSYVSDIGVDERDKIIKSTRASYDALHNALLGGGPEGAGLAFTIANQLKAREDDHAGRVITGTVGDDLMTIQLLNKTMGPTLSGVLNGKIVQSKIPDTLMGLFRHDTTQAMAQPGLLPGGNGQPVTFTDQAGHLLDLEKQGKITSAMRARYLAGMSNFVNDLKDPKIPDTIKENVLKYFISSPDILRSFKTDYYDPDHKVQVQGKYSVWNKLTSDETVASVAKLSRSNPQLAEDYKRKMEEEAGGQLFHQEFLALNDYGNNPHIKFRYNTGDNGGNPYIEAVQEPTPARQVPQDYIRPIQPIINRINGAIAGMSRIERGLGGDTNAYILRFLQHSQADLGKSWEGLPKAIGDAVAASRTPQKRLEDDFKKVGKETVQGIYEKLR